MGLSCWERKAEFIHRVGSAERVSSCCVHRPLAGLSCTSFLMLVISPAAVPDPVISTEGAKRSTAEAAPVSQP